MKLKDQQDLNIYLQMEWLKLSCLLIAESFHPCKCNIVYPIFTRAIEGATRVVFGRNAVQSGARQARIEQNHSLDNLFEGRMIKLKRKPKKKKDLDSDSDESDCELDENGMQDIVRPAVLCTDPQEFLYKVMMERNMDVQNTDIKIGADDGQKIFKINVQLMSKIEKQSEPPSRSSYSEVRKMKLFVSQINQEY